MLIDRIRAPLFALVIVSIFPPKTLANPAIVSVEGALTNAAVLTLKGKGFKNGAPPIIWDTTDNQNYSSLTNGEVIPTGTGLWAQNGNPWSKPIVLTKNRDLRTPYKNATYSGETKGYLGWPRINDPDNQDSLYVTWWFKPSSSISGAGGSNKVIRIWDDSNGNHTRVSWTVDHMTADTESFSAGSSWKMWGGETNQWNRLEIWLDGSTNTLKTWTNGKLIHNYNNFKKSSTTNASLTIGLVGFDPMNSANYSGTKFSLTDIYASRFISRVEISDSDKWATTNSLKEIQPIISWNDTEIKFKLNNGNIKLEKAFLYVVDNNGNVNSLGYPLCSNCPTAPALSVE